MPGVFPHEGIEVHRRSVLRTLVWVIVGLNVGNALSIAVGADTIASRYLLLPLERNPSTWFSAALLALAGTLALVVGHARPDRAEWRLVAGVLWLLSLDEVAMFHERLGHLPGAPGIGSRPWAGLGVVLVAVVAFRLGRWVLGLEHHLRTALVVGGGLFLSGAVGFEVLSGGRRAGHGFDLGFWVLATIEENLEMLGPLVVIAALLSVVCGPGGTCTVSFTTEQRRRSPVGQAGTHG